MPSSKTSLMLTLADPVDDETMAIVVHALAQLLVPSSTACGCGDSRTGLTVRRDGTITRYVGDEESRAVVGRWSMI